MYKVDVIKLKNKLDELNKLLEIYQENFLNMYHQFEISNEDELWLDPHAKSFFDDKLIEKTSIEDSYTELNEVYNLIDEIVSKYSNIGGVVEYDLTNRNQLLSKFNVYKNKLNRLLSIYNNLDYSFASYDIISSIDNQMSSLKEQIYLCDLLRERITKIIDNIKTYESDISKLIKRIFIKTIQTVEVEKYTTSQNNEQFEKNMINIEEMTNVLKKINLYSDLESSNFISILNNLKSVIELYKTENTLSFESLRDSIENKFDDIKDCNTNNISIINRNIDKYSQIDKEVTSDATKLGA